MPRRTLLILALAVMFGLASSLMAQGLTTTASKDDWEEVNFEFNSSILSDGYPSLLRLAELLNQHPDYRVRVQGHTDWVGSDPYNDKLATARAETVRSFLVKYGARDSQIQALGQGKRDPKVDNKTVEGRFMNRRVVLTVTDAQGKVVSAGGVSDAIKALSETQAKSQLCCEDILKKLDKLDDILAMLKELRTENDRLKQDVAALKQDAANLGKAQAATQQQVAQLPKPPERAELTQMMESTAQKAIEETRPKRFQLLGINLGLDTTGNLVANGRGRYFAPFGQNLAFQAGAEYFKFLDRQEGQFDVGLVDRYRNFQAGLFSSFKRVELKQYSAGGTLGQASVAMDYLFSRGRIGAFGTKSFLDDPVLSRVGLSRTLFQETYLNVVDQVGGSTQIALHKDAYIEGNLGALFRRGGSNRPGGTVRFVQPINSHWAFTLEAGLNETLVGSNDSGRFALGLQFGNWLRPKDYRALDHAVPMEVPRIRYEILTRTIRTGNDPPVADAGPDQIGVPAGTIQLDGSASYDPEGDPITFAWTQISGPSVSLTGANTAKASFTAVDGTTYVFRLSVKDDHGAEGRARVVVTTAAAPAVKIVRYAANPPQILAGQTSTIVWEVLNADQVTISGIGSVDPKAGTSTVAPSQTTTYTLTAKNRTSEVSQAITVVVSGARILRFSATPANIRSGEVSTLAWETEGATEVAITGLGKVQPTGTATVTPAQTTTYTLTAKTAAGEVSSTVTVTVNAARILRFVATPAVIRQGEVSTLSWETEGASEVTLSGIGRVAATGSTTVSPTATTTYILTAKSPAGDVNSTVTVTVQRPEDPKIQRFLATPANILAGEVSTLAWQTENATSVTISGIGPVALSGGTTVSPTQTTTYTLTARNATGEINSTVTVTVDRPEVRILRFLATPTNIAIGEAATLAWETENATEVTISGIGSVRPNGSTTVSPTQTTTYTLTAKNLYGEVSTTATVQVTPGEAPRILRFLATPPEILPGEQATLVWQVENAATVTITGIGNVESTGTSTVSPSDTMTYTLTATNPYGTVSATATVVVIRPVKILNFTANPVRTAKAGDPVALSWQTEYATEVVITGIGPLAVNGSVTVNPTADTAYTLVAYGRRSQVSAIVLVRVGANNAPVANAGPDQATISERITLDGSFSYDPDGDPITYSWRVLGNGHADIYGANTAKPSVLLSSGYGTYTFELTVTDSKRASSTDTVIVNFMDP